MATDRGSRAHYDIQYDSAEDRYISNSSRGSSRGGGNRRPVGDQNSCSTGSCSNFCSSTGKSSLTDSEIGFNMCSPDEVHNCPVWTMSPEVGARIALLLREHRVRLRDAFIASKEEEVFDQIVDSIETTSMFGRPKGEISDVESLCTQRRRVGGGASMMDGSSDGNVGGGNSGGGVGFGPNSNESTSSISSAPELISDPDNRLNSVNSSMYTPSPTSTAPPAAPVSLKVFVSVGNAKEVRRLRFARDGSYNDLVSALKLPSSKTVLVTYADDEGDEITIRTDEDLEEAFQFMEAMALSSMSSGLQLFKLNVAVN